MFLSGHFEELVTKVTIPDQILVWILHSGKCVPLEKCWCISYKLRSLHGAKRGLEIFIPEIAQGALIFVHSALLSAKEDIKYADDQIQRLLEISFIDELFRGLGARPEATDVHHPVILGPAQPKGEYLMFFDDNYILRTLESRMRRTGHV